MVFVEGERWLRFLPSTDRNGLWAVRTGRRKKRSQREAIGEKRRPSQEPFLSSVSTSFATAFSVSKTPTPVRATASKSGTFVGLII